MAWNRNVERPDLRAINGGAQFTANSPITADDMNAIVNMMLYLRHKEDTDEHMADIT